MKITDVRAVPLGIPMRGQTPSSPWTAGAAKQVLVRVVTDVGLVGWGECFAYGAPLAVVNVVDEALAPLLVGEDPTAIERLTDKMHRALMIWGRRGLAMFGVSGVELALWDLAGKARRVPVWALLGGLVQPRVRAYASLLRYDSATDVGRAARAAVAEGFTAMKLHQTDVESVAVVREAVGDGVDVMLDTNCPWTVEQAIRMGRELERHGLRWLEEPVWPPEDYAGLARVRAAVSIPIATGENDMTMFGHAAILAAGAADVVQPSVTKVGGLAEMRKIATLAAAAGVTFVPHSYYFGPGLAATLHLCAATPGVPYIEFPPGELEAPLTAEPIRCVDGWVTVGDRPGLGADPDPDVIQRYPYSGARAKPFLLTS
jgi:L-alanine-DL-glutamate epimerase-like enolase superfamily enzyme